MTVHRTPDPEPPVEELDLAIRHYIVAPVPGKGRPSLSRDALAEVVGPDRAETLLATINRELGVDFAKTDAKQRAQHLHVPGFDDAGFETNASIESFLSLMSLRACQDFAAVHPGFSEEALSRLFLVYLWDVSDQAHIYRLGDDLFVSRSDAMVRHTGGVDVALARVVQQALLETELDAEDLRRPPRVNAAGRRIFFNEALAAETGLSDWGEYRAAGGVSVSIRSTRETIEVTPSGSHHGAVNKKRFFAGCDGDGIVSAIAAAFVESF